MDKYSLPSIFSWCGLILVKMAAITLTVCSLLSPVFFDLNFLIICEVVIGLCVKYLRIASSVIACPSDGVPERTAGDSLRSFVIVSGLFDRLLLLVAMDASFCFLEFGLGVDDS